MNNTVTINKKKYKVKNTLRSMFIFEAITKKPFTLSRLMDNYIYMFSILLANNPDMQLTWDDFIDASEKNPSIITEMSKIIEHQGEVKSVIEDDEESDGNEKKN